MRALNKGMTAKVTFTRESPFYLTLQIALQIVIRRVKGETRHLIDQPLPSYSSSGGAG